jgi:Mor family transcriptional regulator
MSTRPLRRRPADLVNDLMEIGGKHLVTTLGMQEQDAQATMRLIAHQFCERNAKCMLYIPEDLQFGLVERDAKIWQAYQLDGPGGAKKFTGARLEQLAAEHSLSIQQIYNIVRREGNAEMATRQGVLPGIDPAE